MLRAAKKRDIDFSAGDLSLLVHPNELALIREIIELPEVVALAATRTEATPIPHYAYELARALAAFYDSRNETRVISENPADLAMSKARLRLIDATRIALGRALNLMGMSAPTRM